MGPDSRIHRQTLKAALLGETTEYLKRRERQGNFACILNNTGVLETSARASPLQSWIQRLGEAYPLGRRLTQGWRGHSAAVEEGVVVRWPLAVAPLTPISSTATQMLREAGLPQIPYPASSALTWNQCRVGRGHTGRCLP